MLFGALFCFFVILLISGSIFLSVALASLITFEFIPDPILIIAASAVVYVSLVCLGLLTVIFAIWACCARIMRRHRSKKSTRKPKLPDLHSCFIVTVEPSQSQADGSSSAAHTLDTFFVPSVDTL